MDLAEFKSAIAEGREPEGFSAALRALARDARGDWNGAHELAQEEPGRDGAWVHAYLHRKQGDLGNAGYWYARAGRPAFKGPLEEEWDAIARELLAESRPSL